MVNSKEDKFVSDDEFEGSDLGNQANSDVSSDLLSSMSLDMSETEVLGSSTVSHGRTNSGSQGSFSERLRDVLSGEGDEDRDNYFSQWLQALDLQLIGACRADERMKPLFKLNVSSGVAEDRLLAQLSQHFDAAEVGILGRCLFVPLVSIRVGKVIKRGSLLCPTAERGNLNLTMLPSSNLAISFVGDDGCTEKLAMLRSKSESSAVVIEDIQSDSSGRSFRLQVPDGQVSYFWCSEKSQAHGAKLLAKVKSLLRKKPSLAKLSGISESRLDCFAIHLHAYLHGSTSGTKASTPDDSPSLLGSGLENSALQLDSSNHLSSSLSEPSDSKGSCSVVVSPYSTSQGSLCPSLNSLADFVHGNEFMERFGQDRDSSICSLSVIDNLPVVSTSTVDVVNLSQAETKLAEAVLPIPILPRGFLEAPEKSEFLPSVHLFPSSQVVPTGPLLFSPYYNWAPPSTSTLQYTVTPPHLPTTLSDSLSLPPLSSLLSAVRSSSPSIPPRQSLDLTNFPPLDLPSFMPDPLVMPVSSFLGGSSSQQIPTFTPFICDPIVHIPVMDVCSSGGYLVSAGPTVSTTITPLHPNPLITQNESVLEKNARETLRLLLASAHQVPFSTSEEQPGAAYIGGSRGLYTVTRDIGLSPNSISPFSMVSFPPCLVSTGAAGKEKELEGADRNWETIWTKSGCADTDSESSVDPSDGKV